MVGVYVIELKRHKECSQFYGVKISRSTIELAESDSLILACLTMEVKLNFGHVEMKSIG